MTPFREILREAARKTFSRLPGRVFRTLLGAALAVLIGIAFPIWVMESVSWRVRDLAGMFFMAWMPTVLSMAFAYLLLRGLQEARNAWKGEDPDHHPVEMGTWLGSGGWTLLFLLLAVFLMLLFGEALGLAGAVLLWSPVFGCWWLYGMSDRVLGSSIPRGIRGLMGDVLYLFASAESGGTGARRRLLAAVGISLALFVLLFFLPYGSDVLLPSDNAIFLLLAFPGLEYGYTLWVHACLDDTDSGKGTDRP